MTDDQLWNARARYLQQCSKETLQKIRERATMFQKGHELCSPMNPEAAMDLAIHQQRLCDHIAARPKGKHSVIHAISQLSEEQLAELREAIEAQQHSAAGTPSEK